MEAVFQTASRRKGLEAIGRNMQWRGKGKLVFNLYNRPAIVFNNGVYRTTDKEEIEALLHSRLMKDDTIELVTDPQLVDQYLRGDEPDKLTKDILTQISDVGLRKIANIVGLSEQKHKNYAGVLRAMLKGTPITDEIHKVMMDNKTEQSEEDLFEKLYDAEEGIIYRNGPWYKYRKGEEVDGKKDFSLGKTEAEVQEWIAKNKDEIKQRLK